MKVLRAHEKGQGQAEWITKGLRDRKLQVDVYNWGQQSLQQYNHSNIFHIHGSLAAYSALSELSKYLENSQVVPLIHYEIKEIRSREEAVRTNFYAHLDESYDENAADRLKQLSALFPACIVENEEAFQYASKYHQQVYIVPYAINPEEFGEAPDTTEESSNDPVLIVHPGTDASSGSEFIEKAVSLLHQEGYNIRYENAHNLNRADAVALMSQADIVIDQLLHGSYGIASVEAMALGKPVLSHLREDLIPMMDPELPVVSANPATLYRKLIPLIESQELRNSLGQAGKEYAAKNHYLHSVIPKILDAYHQELELGPRPGRSIAADPVQAVVAPGESQNDPAAVDVQPNGVPITVAPIHVDPIHVDPMHAAPMHAAPIHADPMHAAPTHAAPIHADLIHADPMHAAPMHADPMHAAPMHAAPMHADPMHAAPMHADPMHADPIHAAPVNAIPLRQAFKEIPPSDSVPLIHVPNPPISNDQGGHQQQQETGVNNGNITSNGAPGRTDITEKGRASQNAARGLLKSPHRAKPMSGALKKHIIYPKLFKSVMKSSTESSSYVYFDLSELPKSAIITKAIMKLPVRLKRKERVSIKRIKGKWGQLISPAIYSKRISLLSGRKSRWNCTKWGRRWHRRPDKNFGIRMSKKLTKAPSLLIKYKSK